jgi:hypothetical protein
LFVQGSDGNVGIGTDIPHSTLQLGSDSQTVAGDGQLTLARSNGAGAAGKFRIGLDANYRLSMGFFHYYGNDTYLPQFCLEQNGKVGIGTAAPVSLLHIASTGNAEILLTESLAKERGGSIRGQGQGGLDGGMLRFWTHANNSSLALVEHLRIDQDGNLTATDTTIGSLSDKRLKTNIKDWSGGLDIVNKLKPVEFKWKNPEEHTSMDKDGFAMGFIAQDIQEVFPDLVKERVSMMDSMDDKLLKEEYDSDTSLSTQMTGRNWAIIVSAVQELSAQVSTLWAVEQDSSSNNAALEARIIALEAA